MAETHAEAAPFLLFLCSFFPTSLSPGRLRQADSQDDFFFPSFGAQIPLYPQIDALSEIDRRRRNECSSVTQRRATRTL